MPAPHHSVFYRLDALRATQPTASKHWRQKRRKNKTRKKTNQLEEVTSVQTSAMVSVATTAI